jgi:Cu(I)/Ag(I) efflux system membrane protein CusA/SilA
MPPLNEGTLLYMPTAVPGMSITEATKILQIQDRQLKKIPEVTTVFRQSRTSRNADRSRAAFDVRNGRHASSRRPMAQGNDVGQAARGMNANIKTPGMANIFWMPIQTRTEMLTTGFRSVLGIKVFGPDLRRNPKARRADRKELAIFRTRAARSPSAQPAAISSISP